MAAATPRVPTSLTQWNNAQQENADQVDVTRLIATVQNALRQRGLVAWVQLGQSLEKAQQSDTAGVGRAALKRVLNENQLSVTEVDTRALLRCLGTADDGRTTAEAVKNLLCGPLTDRRLALVESVFAQLDHQRLGYVSTQDVIAYHDASKHPSVMFGERSPAQVHDEFLQSFQLLTRATTTTSAFVNQYQWMSYFQYVSGHVPSEEYFELVLKRVWKAAPRTTLSEATNSSSKGIVSNGTSAGGVPVAPLSLLQALQDTAYTALPPPAPMTPTSGALPPRLHRSHSLDATTAHGQRHTNAEFLRGTQFAACMVDPTLYTPTPSPRGASARTSPRASTSASSPAAVDALDPGTLSVLTRLRSAIKARGLSSLVALTRQIRLGDGDGDGLLSLAEFKHAIQQTEETAQLQLSESDLRVLFKYLDRDHRGAIPVAVALDFIRTPLSARRLELVRFAFATVLEASVTSAMDPSDLVQKYDAARHPDVIAGRKTEELVFQEFIENFDLDDGTSDTTSPSGGSGSGSSHGTVSLAQWEHYYQNVGFFVGDDDYFELLVRNTWQLTHVPAVVATATATAMTPVAAADKRAFRGFTTGHNSRQTFAVLQPELSDHHASVLACERHGLPHATTPSFASAPYAQHRATQSKDLRRILHTLRTALKDQGAVGFISLQRAFRLMDTDQNGAVSRDELARALRESKVHTLSTHDVENLFHYFDLNHDGAIDCHEFMAGVREPMTERRLLFVRMAFDALDKDRNGVLEVTDLVDVYDAKRHPDVLAGRKTQEDVFREFLESFDVDHLSTDGKVTFDEWTRYYANISASIDDDDYFELMMRNAWHISGGTGWCANSTNRRLLVTHADGSASVEEVQNDLGVSKLDAPRVLAMQLAGRAGATGGIQRTSFYDVLDHTTRPASATGGTGGTVRSKNNSSSSIAACLGATNDPGTTSLSVTTQPPPRRRGSLPPPVTGTLSATATSASGVTYLAAPAGVQAIITRLKTALKAQGAHGFCGLSRKFRLMDDDGNGALNLVEFRNALRACALDGVADNDVRLLFQYFDRDRSGAIDLSEFLYGVRDPMNDRRVAFVREAFRRMDKDGNGLLEPSDIVEAFDASQHPDVLTGRKTPDEVFRAFLETFDVDGVHDGKITWDQWLHYYHNVSASIDDDDYFELMMRNAWHISGGTGWCANSTTRRVLVTLDDGREVVREVQDDLGVKIQDVQARLQAQDRQSQQQPTDAASSASICGIATSAAMDLTQPPLTKKIVSLKDVSFSKPMQAPPPQPSWSSMSSSSSGLAGDAVFWSIRRRLQHQTLAVVVTLRKRVTHYIDAKTGTVSAAHCAEALSMTLGLALTEPHCVALFAYLHAQPLDDGYATGDSSTTSIGARLLQTQHQHNRMALSKLFAGLLGALSDRNRESVRCVFSALQAAGNGRVFPVALARSFQAGNHPDVKLGLVTADAVFQDFAASFEVSGSPDGAVTMDQFEAFCVNWRATVASDEYLDVLLRECFRVAE